MSILVPWSVYYVKVSYKSSTKGHYPLFKIQHFKVVSLFYLINCYCTIISLNQKPGEKVYLMNNFSFDL